MVNMLLLAGDKFMREMQRNRNSRYNYQNEFSLSNSNYFKSAKTC